jgi:hypothetical protein
VKSFITEFFIRDFGADGDNHMKTDVIGRGHGLGRLLQIYIILIGKP